MTRRLRYVVLGGLLVAAAALPVVVNDNYVRQVLTLALIYVIVAASWDLTLGYAGIFNFAHVAIFAGAAYVSGVLAVELKVPPLLAVVPAALVAAGAGFLVYLPVLRLKGIYIALLTFGFGQVLLQVVLSQAEWTGGSQGLVSIPPIRIGSLSFRANGGLGYYYLLLVLAVASIAILAILTNSRFGRSLVALRDNEDYAVSRGISPGRYRLGAIVISSLIAGAAGGIYSTFLGVASPEFFGFAPVALTLTMVLLGGAGTLVGPVIGAVVLTIGNEALINLGPWRFVLISGLIVLIIAFQPDGLWPAIARRIGRRGTAISAAPALERPSEPGQ